MATLAHLSDLHFGRINTDVVRDLLAELAVRRPDLVVISGDLTQRALRAEFRRAGAFLERLEFPWLVVPGNHDIPSLNFIERFVAPTARYRRYICDDLHPVFQNESFIATGFNTARPFGPYWDWSRGRVSYRQMEHVHEQLSAVPAGMIKVVVTHHPFLLSPATFKRRLVGRSAPALERFRRVRVDLVLSGHLHKAYSDTVEVDSVQGKGSIIVAQASTATSTRLKDEPNAYNWITLENDSITVENRCWAGASGFRTFCVHRYRRRGALWVKD